jgi:hypothetical protein
MESGPNREFGKRRPVKIPLASTQPVKRSRHVALLVMGTFAIGGGAYALMPGANCGPNGAGMAGPSFPQASAACLPRGAFSGGYGSHTNIFSGDATSNRVSSAGSGTGEVTRGGFGSFARSFAAHFSGGG